MSPFKIALVLSVFNKDVSYALKEGALRALKSALEQPIFKFFEVPGVVEIPLASQWLLKQDYSAVIALGCVIRGETSHYESCCRLVESGCMQVQLNMGRPVVFGVLTTENKQQALARAGGAKGDMGGQAVNTALAMLKLKNHIDLL